jgi:chromosome condensin MukBEF ATPase and DNA-binding subunit MukB
MNTENPFRTSVVIYRDGLEGRTLGAFGEHTARINEVAERSDDHEKRLAAIEKRFEHVDIKGMTMRIAALEERVMPEGNDAVVFWREHAQVCNELDNYKSGLATAHDNNQRLREELAQSKESDNAAREAVGELREVLKIFADGGCWRHEEPSNVWVFRRVNAVSPRHTVQHILTDTAHICP